MVKEFSIELTVADGKAICHALGTGNGAVLHPDVSPGRKTFAFDEDALVAISGFERFPWSAFDRVEERGGIITLARGTDLVFYLPVAKLQDPEIVQAIWDFVSGRVALNG